MSILFVCQTKKVKIINRDFGIFQNAGKVVNKYNKYSIKGDSNPMKLQIF